MADMIPWLPHLLAFCNVTTMVLLISGVVAIRQGEQHKHKVYMLAAVAVAILFLIFYVIYHRAVGNLAFAGEGKIRWVYFSILISHVVLAAAVLPMVPMTLIRGLKGFQEPHKRLARKTLPIWLYVSVSGIVVYVMAFHLFPPGE